MEPHRNATSGTEVERYFPLVDGHVYHYVSMGDSGEQGLLVARVVRVDETHGELRFPTGGRKFEYSADGVRALTSSDSSAFVLKTPVSLGSEWRGEHGGQTRVVAVDAQVDVPAGHFVGCVQTLEERRGDRPARFATTFCPDTGIVLLEVQSGANLERAELKSYGAPVDLGPDGLKRVE